MKLFQFRLILVLLTIIPYIGLSQKTRIQILDNINNEPVAFANLVISPIDNNTILAGYVSDENGIVIADIEDISIIRLSYIGFNDYSDTISPGVDKTIYLKSISYNVDEVVVTGQYGESTQDKSIYKVTVINAKEIDQRAAVNVKEMLSTELNIRTTFDGALGSSMTMRGLGGEHIKLLIDGVPVIGRENGNIDLDQINLQNVDHVEVINGPMSVVYGSNALAGVVNIIMKPPDKYLFSSQLETYYESVGVYNVNASVSGTYKRNSLSITGGRNFFDGYNPPGYSKYMISGLSDAAARWKPKEQWNFSGDYKYKWNKAYLKLGASLFKQELRDEGLLELPYYETRTDQYFYTTRMVYRSDFRYDFSKRSRLNATASYSKYEKIKNTSKIDLTTLKRFPTPGMQDTTLFDNTMFRSDYSYGDEKSIIKYQFGVDLNKETGSGKRIENNNQQIGDYAVFASMNYMPWAVLNIQPGVRFIHNTRFSAPVIFSLNAKYDITERFLVRVSVASGFRAPSLKELYLNFVDVNHNIHGNPDLLAETSLNTNLLFQFNSTAERDYVWGLELNLFNNNIKDNIQLLEVGTNNLIFSYINVNRFTSRGAEINFNNNVYPWLTVKFGITLTGQKAEYSVDKSTGFENYTDFNASLNYWIKKYDLNFSVYYKYNGRSPRLNQAQSSDELEMRFMSPYQTLDINAGKWLWKRRINLQVGAKNLFDNTEVDISGSTGGTSHASADGGSSAVNWGRTFFVKLQFRFNK
jgi:outer membrane receptor for ferrienterochelin and colicins